MGRAWFTTHWLDTYRNIRDLRRQGAAADERFHAFTGLLQQGTASAMSSAQTALARTILQMGLEVLPLQRPSAPEMLAACNQTQGQVAVQPAEHTDQQLNLQVVVAAGANEGTAVDQRTTDDHGPTVNQRTMISIEGGVASVGGAEQRAGGVHAQTNSSVALHIMGSLPPESLLPPAPLGLQPTSNLSAQPPQPGADAFVGVSPPDTSDGQALSRTSASRAAALTGMFDI